VPFPAHAGVFLTFHHINRAGIFGMSLILPLKACDADGLSVIVLDNPNWGVLRALVAAHQATAGVPPDQRFQHSDLIETALQEAIEEVAGHLLPDWPELDDEDEEPGAWL
jgi:hypothetical protein